MSFKKTNTFKEVDNLLQNYQYDKAKQILDKNKNQFFNDGFFFSLLGYLCDCQNNYLDAERNYLKAIDLDQELLEAKLNLAILYLKIKDLNKSEVLFNQILKKKKKYLFF